MAKNEGTNYTPWILVATAVLIFAALIYPTLANGTLGQNHYTASMNVYVSYSLNPIDIATGNLGITYDNIAFSNTGAICYPSFKLGSLLPSQSGSRVVVSASNSLNPSISSSADLGAFYVDPITGFSKHVELSCLTSGSYNAQIALYKADGTQQVRSFTFTIPG